MPTGPVLYKADGSLDSDFLIWKEFGARFSSLLRQEKER